VKTLLILSLILYSFSLHAEIFRWVDENGQVRYSPKPQEGATKVKIQPTVKIPTKQTPITKLSPKSPIKQITKKSTTFTTKPNNLANKQTTFTTYSNLSILSPAHQSRVFSANLLLPISLSATPPLQKNHAYRLIINKLLMPGKWTSPHIKINLSGYRAYNIQAVIVDHYGKFQAQSTLHQIQLFHRPSGTKIFHNKPVNPAYPFRPNYNSNNFSSGNAYNPTYSPNYSPNYNSNYRPNYRPNPQNISPNPVDLLQSLSEPNP